MSFTNATIAGKSVHPLGLAATFGLEPAGAERALDAGMNYLFSPHRAKKKDTRVVLLDAIKRDRERFVLVSGPLAGFFGGSVRRACEASLKALGTDYIDVFQLYWLGKMSSWAPRTIDALVQLREEGKVRNLGISIHDRPRAGRLAADSPLDLLMIRYNAAHPGAEQDIFPHLAEGKKIVSYTATSWRKLLKRPRGWHGPVPEAGHCYRFVLSNPHVSVCLCGPATREQLEQNLAAFDQGPLDEEEMAWMREFGRVVHG